MPIPASRPSAYKDPVYGHDAMYRAQSRYSGYGNRRLRSLVRRTAKECMEREAELKHTALTFTHSPVSSGGLVSAVNILSQGTSATTRIGNQVRGRHLNLRGEALVTGGGSGCDSFRVIVFVDSETNGSAPGVSDVLESNNIYAPYNHTFVSFPGKRNRFTILRDRTISVNRGDGTGADAVQAWNMRIPLRTLTYYQSNAGTVSDVLKNGLFVITISYQGEVSCQWTAQYCWIDI